MLSVFKMVKDSTAAVKLLEISVETDGEAAEAVSAIFNQYSRSGAVIEEVWPNASQSPVVRVKTFLSAEHSAALTKIEQALWHLGQLYPIPSPSVCWLSEADWAEAWKSDYRVQRIGKHIVIKPSWLPYIAAPGQVVIELDPGLAFGTGLHPSTRLSLEALEQHLLLGHQVLDVGTGSGILAIAAAKLGAGSVIALDIDDTALQVAQENIVRNAVQGIVSLQKASLSPVTTWDRADIRRPCWTSERSHCPVIDLASESNSGVTLFNASGLWDETFDLLLMNIEADVIAKSAEAIARCLSAGGNFIISGIIQPKEHSVREALSAAGLIVVKRRVKKDWVALIGRRTHDGIRRDRKESGQSDAV